jgi:NADP-dependent 3-hydroxy acid dehydrogenase YdfG
MAKDSKKLLYVVTGANSGLGLQAALYLAKTVKNATVVLTGRDEARLAAALEQAKAAAAASGAGSDAVG